MATARPRANLERLLVELQASASLDARCRERLARPHADAARIAARLPLSHCCSSHAFVAVARAGRLLSQRRLHESGARALDPAAVEVTLGTDDCVFTFAAPFRYPGQAAGFLFPARAEPSLSARAVATPFDSGALVSHCQRPDPAEPLGAFMSRHELPVPDYRGYLERALTCAFPSPWHYVDGGDPDGHCPPGLTGGDARRHTFEVRVRHELPLEGALAVFLPAEIAALDEVADALAQWRLADEDVRICSTDWEAGGREETLAWGGLTDECARYLNAYLERPDGE